MDKRKKIVKSHTFNFNLKIVLVHQQSTPWHQNLQKILSKNTTQQHKPFSPWGFMMIPLGISYVGGRKTAFFLKRKQQDMRSSTLPQSGVLDSYRLVPVGYVERGVWEFCRSKLPNARLPCEMVGVGHPSKFRSGVGELTRYPFPPFSERRPAIRGLPL